MGNGRGRPRKVEEEKVLSNGLFPRQWERLQMEAKQRGYAETMPLLRAIVDEYFAQEDADAASAGETVELGDDEKFDKDTLAT